MNDGIGIACGACDTFSPVGAHQCPRCGQNLNLGFGAEAERGQEGATQVTPGVAGHPGAAAGETSLPRAEPALQHGFTPSQEERMEQARSHVCTQCSTLVPSGHKFCGRCGAPVPDDILQQRTEFFGAMQAPGKARLILIRGDSNVDGLSYLLQGSEHVAGRNDGQILFPEDAWLSPRHANFYYNRDKLIVRDEESVNGIYVRIRQPMPLLPGDQFLCGEEVFRLEPTPKDDSGPGVDQTYFYASPRRPSPFRVVQILKGGSVGMVYCARESSIQIGRDESDMNFPDDVFMSANHAKVELAPDGRFTLADNGSKNGTYLKVREEVELQHGDYVFLGKQLLRVEMTA